VTPIKWVAGATIVDGKTEIHGVKWAIGSVVYRKWHSGRPASKFELALWKRLLKLEKK